MNRSVHYLVITPVRNEERYFERTVDSIRSQSIVPDRWVIVDDGSSDRTGKIADDAATRYPFIQVLHRTNRGFRQSGAGVVEAFNDGLALVMDREWTFIAKLDGDLAFRPDYFECCFAEFERDSRLGIGGGAVCDERNGKLSIESQRDPAFHVRGATKIYRKQCWEELGGLVKAPGWDTIDELKANMKGWRTRTFTHLKIHQLKQTGIADGSWRNWVKNGMANYAAGYHPLFMAAKCASRLIRPPRVLAAAALAWGYIKGYATGASRVDDPELIQYVRKQQLNRLRRRPSLWDALLTDATEA